MTPSKQSSGELLASLLTLLPVFKRAGAFSIAVNLLVLAPTVYMLEVYDRVVNSRSDETLAMLTILVLGAYALMEAFEWVRREMLCAAAEKLDRQLASRIFSAVFQGNLKQLGVGGAAVFGDFRTLKEFLAGPATLAMLDAPASILFLGIVFFINPLMGLVALIVVAIQLMLTYVTERITRKVLDDASKRAIVAQGFASATLRNAEVVTAMGMRAQLHDRWMEVQQKQLFLQADASKQVAVTTATGKFFQLLQGSLLIGLGAWLTLKGELVGGGGMMLVASIIAGRAVAPLGQIIMSWKTVTAARQSYRRLDNLLTALPPQVAGMPLPAPAGKLSVEGVSASAPGSNIPILRQVAFSLTPGTTLGVIGPSASGKSTLARLLVGIWKPLAGRVRLDGVDVSQWNKAELGPHVGYLPQDVELFDGTLAENIARFGEVDMDRVEDSARRAGLESWVNSLPNGYETLIGDEGESLSGGQRQLVALARAIFGRPSFLVLDEPNASLDEVGEQALVQALMWLKAEGTTIVVITHRTSILSAVDQLLVMKDGAVAKMGTRDEVCAAMGMQPVQKSASAGSAHE